MDRRMSKMDSLSIESTNDKKDKPDLIGVDLLKVYEPTTNWRMAAIALFGCGLISQLCFECLQKIDPLLKQPKPWVN